MSQLVLNNGLNTSFCSIDKYGVCGIGGKRTKYVGKTWR